MSAASPRVIGVLVTWNRPALLVEALAALAGQSRPLDGLVVVDNASDEPVAHLLPDHAHAVRLERNTGGAGGFTVGIAEALEVLDADFVWLMDDDTIPEPTALEELLRVQHAAPESARIFGSRVVWTDGRPHPMNMPRVRPFASKASVEAAKRHHAYPVRSISFVSVMVDARAIRELGLPIAEYFLWNDDFEFTSRILRRYTGFLCERSLVVHKTKVFGSTDIDPGPRFAFEVRNKAWMLRHSPALSPFERVLYTGATARTWLKTIARSSDRGVLGVGLTGGFRDARSLPKPNTESLADLDPTLLEHIRAVEAGAQR